MVIARNPSLDRLRELVHRGSRDNPHLTSRLEKAAFLLLLRPILSLGDQHFQVGSEDGLRCYEIVNGHCQCSDYLRHGPEHPCKHRLALSLNQRLGAKFKSGDADRISGHDPFLSDDSSAADPPAPV